MELEKIQNYKELINDHQHYLHKNQFMIYYIFLTKIQQYINLFNLGLKTIIYNKKEIEDEKEMRISLDQIFNEERII